MAAGEAICVSQTRPGERTSNTLITHKITKTPDTSSKGANTKKEFYKTSKGGYK